MRLGTGVMQGLGQIMGEIFTPLDFNKGHYPLLTLLSRLHREQHCQLFQKLFLYIFGRAILKCDVR